MELALEWVDVMDPEESKRSAPGKIDALAFRCEALRPKHCIGYW